MNEALQLLISEKLSDPAATVVLLGAVQLSHAEFGTPRACIVRIDAPCHYTPTQINDPIGLPGDLDLPDASADLVFSADWHERSFWYRWSFQEIARVLKRDGLAASYVSVLDRTAISLPVRQQCASRVRALFARLTSRAGVHVYSSPAAIVEELGFAILREEPVKVRRSVTRLQFDDDGIIGSVQRCGQSGVVALFGSKEDPTYPANERLGDRAAVEAVIARDYGQERVRQSEEIASAGVPSRAGSLRTQLPGESALVLSPHPDDEIIGAGGALLELRANGGQVTILQMSNGQSAASLQGQPDALRRTVRLTEAKRVAGRMGAHLVEWADVADGAEPDFQRQTARLLRVVQQRQPDMIFVPHWSDNHADHRNACRILLGVLEQWNPLRDCHIISYEVWGFLPFNLAIDVSVWSRYKFDLLSEYRSALRSVNYARSTQWLSAWRSFEAFGRAGQAEVFLALTRAEYATAARLQLSQS